MKRNIVIFGAGVGGLTAAHQLAKNPLNQITIFEKSNEIGGLARSGRDEQGCATEYCWRVFFGFYKNLFDILREIPANINDVNSGPYIKECNTNQSTQPVPDMTCADYKSVLGNLTRYGNQNFSSKKMNLPDLLHSGYNIVKGVTSSDNRLD